MKKMIARNKRERREAEGLGFDPEHLTREQFETVQARGVVTHPQEGERFVHPNAPHRRRLYKVPFEFGLH